MGKVSANIDMGWDGFIYIAALHKDVLTFDVARAAERVRMTPALRSVMRTRICWLKINKNNMLTGDKTLIGGRFT